MSDDGEQSARAPRGRYAKTAEVRDKIAIAATDVFAALGYHAATFKQVAAEAGVSERGVVYHFPTKEALLIAVLDHHETVVGRSGDPRTDDGARTLAWVLRNILDDQDAPTLVELHSLLSAESVSAEHPAHERYRVRYHQFRQFIGIGFEQLAQAGELRVDCPAEQLAAGLIALMDGLQLQWLHEPTVDVQGTIDAYLSGILHSDPLERMQAYRASDRIEALAV